MLLYRNNTNVKNHRALPKYRQIADDLLEKIRATMEIGDKFPGEVELARDYGVHVLTIREALKVLQEGGVIQRRKASGTIVLNPMGGKWVAILSEVDLFSPKNNAIFHRRVIYQVRRNLIAQKIPARVSVGSNERDEAPTISTCFDFLGDVEADRLIGLIALGTVPDSGWLDKLVKNGIPAVGGSNFYPSHVTFDEHATYQKLAKILAKAGTRRLAWIGWTARDLRKKSSFPERIGHAFEKSGITIKPEWVREDIHPATPGAGRTQFDAIFGDGTCTADTLVVHDEHMIADVLKACAERKIRIPTDIRLVVSVTGGGPQIDYGVPVIRIEYDPIAFADAMSTVLIAKLHGKAPPRNPVLIHTKILMPG